MANQLLPEIPKSKFEKLAGDCQHPSLQLPCKTNQRWYCQLEEGRWRKHKCKQQIQFPTANNKIFKKCACFTPDGLVYKKILVSCGNTRTCSSSDDPQPVLQVNNTLSKRNTRLNRFKRDPALHHILLQRIGRRMLSYRQKRDTLTHVESVMETVKDKLTGLQVSFFYLE